MAPNTSSQQLNIPTDQRQNYEQFRDRICEHIRERFSSTMGQDESRRATGQEIVDWLRQQSVEQLSRPVEQTRAGSKT